jgi:hypothetical protein
MYYKYVEIIFRITKTTNTLFKFDITGFIVPNRVHICYRVFHNVDLFHSNRQTSHIRIF